MKKVKGQPITGAKPQTSSKRPFVPDAKETSADEQVMIAEAPSPFKNRNQTGEMPAGTGPKGAVPGPVRKPYAGLQHSNPGAKALPKGAAIGQGKMPNQSFQIGGRMGYPPPKRKAGMNGQGFPSKRNASFYGE